MRKNSIFFWLVIAGGALTACNKNQSVSYSDFDYQTAYFATQFPVRTVELGEDLFVDNSLDNEHKVSIKATTGGVRENTNDVVLDFAVDESLCNGLYFTSGGNKVVPLPSSYYKLSSNQIIIPKGSILGGVEMELTDAFFNDPLSIANNYAIPLKLTNVKGADSILRGLPSVSKPNPCIDGNWVVKPRDFIIYAVKYVNPMHGNYLRRGADVITGSLNTTVVRHKQYVENDEVNKAITTSLSQVSLPVIFKNQSGTNVTCNLLLTFEKNGACSVSSGTNQVTATGSGSFVKKGEKNSWGSLDRDAIYLKYTVDIPAQNMHVESTDTLVLRDRAVMMETYTPVVQ